MLTDLTRRYYRAYETGDRSFLDATLTADFTFTSPFDDAISRDAYFGRCWPGHVNIRKFHIGFIAEQDGQVMVAYRAEMSRANVVHTEAAFGNCEAFTFEGGKIKSVKVYFGDPPNGLTHRQFAEQCGAA